MNFYILRIFHLYYEFLHPPKNFHGWDDEDADNEYEWDDEEAHPETNWPKVLAHNHDIGKKSYLITLTKSILVPTA